MYSDGCPCQAGLRFGKRSPKFCIARRKTRFRIHGCMSLLCKDPGQMQNMLAPPCHPLGHILASPCAEFRITGEGARGAGLGKLSPARHHKLSTASLQSGCLTAIARRRLHSIWVSGPRECGRPKSIQAEPLKYQEYTVDTSRIPSTSHPPWGALL